MKHILSIQSHVASGYAGNRAAVFPLQRLGCEVSFINTVQFSNHTGYTEWSGEILTSTHIQNIINGLRQHGTLAEVDSVLSSYQGSASLGKIIIDTIVELKQQRPTLLYCCDPVIGDVESGIYVLPETAQFIKNHAIKFADIITPNQFELAYLSGQSINSLEDTTAACKQLHQLGPKIILVTSLRCPDIPTNHIAMLVSNGDKMWLTTTPRFTFTNNPSGSGDTATAIFLAKYLQEHDIVATIEHTTAAMYAIFNVTHANGSYELQLISTQNEIVSPKQSFPATQVV